MKKFLGVGAFLTAMCVSSAAFAADCTTDVKKDDLTDEQVQAARGRTQNMIVD